MTARGARGARHRIGGLAPSPCLLLACAAVLTACSGVASPDLFVVERSGTVAGAPLTMVVSEEGVVHCNRGPAHRLSDPAVIEARTIAEELQRPASHHLSLPARAGSVYGYRVRDVNGSVSFADNSTGQPVVLEHLQLFTLQTAERVCRLTAPRR
jgi:hypothetical protein